MWTNLATLPEIAPLDVYDLAVVGISLEEMAKVLDLAPSDLRRVLMARPAVREAYLEGCRERDAAIEAETLARADTETDATLGSSVVRLWVYVSSAIFFGSFLGIVSAIGGC